MRGREECQGETDRPRKRIGVRETERIQSDNRHTHRHTHAKQDNRQTA